MPSTIPPIEAAFAHSGQDSHAHFGSLHHVTAIASDVDANVYFYARILGLRLVKKTVNFDDPGSYHLYYGDYTGSPGSLLTFFVWPGSRALSENGAVIASVGFLIDRGSMGHWRRYLEGHGVTLTDDGASTDRLDFLDSDGLLLYLKETTNLPAANSTQADRGLILRLAGVNWSCRRPEKTGVLFTQVLGYRAVPAAPEERLVSADDQSVIALRPDEVLQRPRFAPGQIHHVAFRAADLRQQAEVAEILRQRGIQVTPVQKRKYFDSVYFMEPGGGICEIATDGPGMTVDEPLGSLGTHLCLPPALEPQRMEITAGLPPFNT